MFVLANLRFEDLREKKTLSALRKQLAKDRFAIDRDIGLGFEHLCRETFSCSFSRSFRFFLSFS